MPRPQPTSEHNLADKVSRISIGFPSADAEIHSVIPAHHRSFVLLVTDEVAVRLSE